MQEKGRICLFSLDLVGFQKVCTNMKLTDGNGRHPLMVRPGAVTSWVNQTIIAYLTDAAKVSTVERSAQKCVVWWPLSLTSRLRSCR